MQHLRMWQRGQEKGNHKTKLHTDKAKKNEMDFVLIRIYVLYCWVRLRQNVVLNPSSLGYSAQKNPGGWVGEILRTSVDEESSTNDSGDR
jgi:hypothetical protein